MGLEHSLFVKAREKDLINCEKEGREGYLKRYNEDKYFVAIFYFKAGAVSWIK